MDLIVEKPDETEYLLKSENNRKILMESIDQIDKGEVIKVDFGTHCND